MCLCIFTWETGEPYLTLGSPCRGHPWPPDTRISLYLGVMCLHCSLLKFSWMEVKDLHRYNIKVPNLFICYFNKNTSESPSLLNSITLLHHLGEYKQTSVLRLTNATWISTNKNINSRSTLTYCVLWFSSQIQSWLNLLALEVCITAIDFQIWGRIEQVAVVSKARIHVGSWWSSNTGCHSKCEAGFRGNYRGTYAYGK
jgi:hypothetical protein